MEDDDVSDAQDDLIIEDTKRRQQGLPIEEYDALLIYSENDTDDCEFAKLIIWELTKQRNLKVR